MIKAMDGAATLQIEDILAKNSRIGIAVGKNPSIDAMGAALALFLFLRTNKQVTIACPTEPIVEISSLVGIDKVKTEINGEGGDLIVSFPYREGEIDKVSYTLEEGLLNIVVKAGEAGLSFDQNQVKFKRSGGLPTVLFIVGTSRLSDLGNLFNPEALKDTTIVNIDNQTDNQGFGDVVMASPHYSSVSEQVADLLVALQADIDTDMAQNLLSGIVFATKNFVDPKTSATAFEMVGILMKKGAVRETRPVVQQQFREATTPSAGQRMQQFFGQRPFPRQQGQSRAAGSGSAGQRFHRSGQEEAPLEAAERKEDPFIKRQGQGGSQPQQSRAAGSGSAGQFRPSGQPQDKRDEDEEAPPDWLAPKVYKGSTLV